MSPRQEVRGISLWGNSLQLLPYNVHSIYKRKELLAISPREIPSLPVLVTPRQEVRGNLLQWYNTVTCSSYVANLRIYKANIFFFPFWQNHGFIKKISLFVPWLAGKTFCLDSTINTDRGTPPAEPLCSPGAAPARKTQWLLLVATRDASDKCVSNLTDWLYVVLQVIEQSTWVPSAWPYIV